MGGCGRGWRRRMKETERAPSEGERRDRKSTRRRKKERSKRDEGQRQQAGRRIRGRRSKWEPYGQAREAREHGWFTKQTVGERVTKAIGVEKFNCAYFRSDISQILRPFPRVYPFPFLTHLCFLVLFSFALPSSIPVFILYSLSFTFALSFPFAQSTKN